MPVVSSTGSATPRTEPSHRRGPRARRLDVTLLAGATAVGLWLGIAAPGVSPVAAPVAAAAPVAVAPAPVAPAAVAPSAVVPATPSQPDGPGPRGGDGR